MSADYPDVTALEDRLVASGLQVPSEMDTERMLGAAIRWWEEKTGYRPFLAEGTIVARYFDPPGPMAGKSFPVMGGGTVLFLRPSFVTVSEVRIGVSREDEGTLLDLGKDYELEPYHAEDEDRPYTRIRFVTPQRGYPRSLKVVGVEGYCQELPSDVYEAILDRASFEFCRHIQQGLMGNPIDWKEDDVSERYSIELVQKLGEGWGRAALSKVFGYRRMS